MPYVKCLICNEIFYIRPSHLARGHGKYCSIKCSSEGRKKGKFIICEVCGKEKWKMPKELKNSKSKKFFCSKRCQTIWRNKQYIEEKHANWKGGEFVYLRIMKESGREPKCEKCGFNNKKVLVIHHKDRNRKNYDINNLMWLCRNCHYLIHNGKTV